MARRRVAIVPHTHWDREWHDPFPSNRLRLVDALDGFLPSMEADDGDCAHLLLDGQVAVVDDYLEARPEAEPLVRRLAAAGRLAIGPWYVQPDELLVSGETLVRNLQLGLARADALGGAMRVAYLPDSFGHCAQMPQLLASAGIWHAVVWRGVPSAVDRTAFLWSAPDGSTVRAEYLVAGYGNGAALPDDAWAVARRVALHDRELGSFLLGPMLLMAGTDQRLPPAWLGRVVREANDVRGDYELVVTSLSGYLDAAPAGEQLPQWTGELRSAARTPLLRGVASTRLDVKQAAARCERALERLAEPMSALFLPPDRWPGRLLDMAWREVIRNSAHDSICACSADEVVATVLHRFAEATQAAEAVAARAAAAVAESVAVAGPVVANPAPRARSGVVELVVEGDETPSGTQVLEEWPAAVEERVLDGRRLPALLGGLHSGAIGARSVDVAHDGDAVEVVIDTCVQLDLSGGGQLDATDPEPAVRELYAWAGAHPDGTAHVRVQQAAARRVLGWVDEVPGFGWAAWRPGPAADPVEVDGTVADNGLVRVAVDRRDGTFSIDGLAGLGRLVDDGDHGDTYTWSAPADDVVVDRPDSVEVTVTERGPLRARLLVIRSYRWPDHVDSAGSRRTGGQPVEVATTVEIRAGERFVRVGVHFDNPCADHRLRAWLPLPHPAQSSLAECAFAVVERPLATEGGPQDAPVATHPSRRFVHAGGLTVVHDGLPEYELVGIDGDRAHALALTLLRATGVLARSAPANRPVPAGPSLPVPANQRIGPIEARFALAVGDIAEVDPYALADQVLVPLLVAHATGRGSRSERGSGLAVEGAEVSAVRRIDAELELRVFNPSDAPTTVRIPGRSGRLVDLRGGALTSFAESFELQPWAIAAARLR